MNFALFFWAMSGNALRKLTKENDKVAKSQENTGARVSFLLKLQVSVCNFLKPETLVRGCFSKFWENFSEHLFYGAPLDDCFCIETSSAKCSNLGQGKR